MMSAAKLDKIYGALESECSKTVTPRTFGVNVVRSPTFRSMQRRIGPQCRKFEKLYYKIKIISYLS